MTAKRLALACAAATGLLAAAYGPAIAQQPGQLGYEETLQCVKEGQRLDRELPQIDAQRPEIERDGAAVERLGQQVDALRERSTAVFDRSAEHTSELQSLMRISYAVFCLKTKT